MDPFAWPLAALIGAVVFMVIFRQPITRLIDRIREIGKEGVTTGNLVEAGQEQEQTTAVTPSAADKLLEQFDNALLTQKEKAVRDDLDSHGVQGSERERVLVRHYSALAIILDFERTYALIFGSQLSALQYLNTQQSGADRAPLKVFYDQAAKAEPKFYANYTFDQWLGFLQAALLTKQSGNTVAITLRGIEFLKYVIQQGYTLAKAG